MIPLAKRWRARRAERRTLTVLGAVAMGFKTAEQICGVVGFWPSGYLEDLVASHMVTHRLAVYGDGSMSLTGSEMQYTLRVEPSPVDDTAARIAHQRVKDLTHDNMAMQKRITDLLAENESLKEVATRYTVATETSLGVAGWCLACCGNQHHACQGGLCRCSSCAGKPQELRPVRTGPLPTHRACEQAYARNQNTRICVHCAPVLSGRVRHTCTTFGGKDEPADCTYCEIEQDMRLRHTQPGNR